MRKNQAIDYFAVKGLMARHTTVGESRLLREAPAFPGLLVDLKSGC